MNKVILLSMFFLGNITAFAQTNPYIEQIDSVVDCDGNYIESYTYNNDGSMTLIRSYVNNPDGLNSVIYEEDTNQRLIHKYQYSQDAIGVIYLSAKEDFEYDSKGRVTVKDVYNSEKKRLYLSQKVKYDYTDSSDKPYSSHTETYLPDKNEVEKVVTSYDELGRESNRIISLLENDVVLRENKLTNLYPEDDDNIIRIERTERYDSEEKTWILFNEKVLYADGGVFVSEIFVDSSSEAPYNQTRYDRYGVMISDSCYTDNTMLIDNVFGDDGKLKEAVRIEFAPEQKYLAKYSYDYFLSDDGFEYYTRTTSSYVGPDEWKANETVVYVPEKVEDGVSTDFYAYEGGEVKCQFFEKGLLSVDARLTMSDGKMVTVSKDVYTRDADGDATLIESYAKASSDAANDALQLTKRTVCQFDDSVPISFINGYRYYDWKKKILSMSYETPDGEEYYRQDYYYTSDVTTDIKLYPEQSIRPTVYSINGQRVNAPKVGQIYIQNNKKFVVK